MAGTTATQSPTSAEGAESCPSVSEDRAETISEGACPDAEIAGLKAELEDTRAKLAEITDKMLRIAAEGENARKRWERERGEVRQYSITEFARDLLPVIDAFDKAMTAVESCDIKPDTEEGKKVLAVVEGVQLVSQMFHDSVKKHGIVRLPGKGELFNPSYHNAIARIVDAAIERETVIDEFVSGYKIGDRVLRTAMVRVAVKE
jgi:molecular chaperone GrpE